MVPGMIGQLQAIEIVKILLGFSKEKICTERMVIFDGLSMHFRNVRIRGKNSTCICCGTMTPEADLIKDVALFDYDDFCQTNCDSVALIELAPENKSNVQDFDKNLKDGSKKIAIVDVRNKTQFGITHIEGAINISLKDLKKDSAEVEKLSKSCDTVYMMCRRGIDSKEATDFLVREKTLKNVVNIEGGLNAYSKIDPNTPFY